MSEVDDYLTGAGVPSVSWRNCVVGQSVTGTVCRAPQLMQRRDVQSGELEYWPDGKPKMQLVIDLQTDDRDSSNADDDGQRRLYVKGKSMTDGFRSAVRASGRKGVEVGGKVSVTYIGEGPQTNKAFNPPKLFAVSYVPPAAPVIDLDAALGKVASDAPAGVDPAAWRAMDEPARARVRAALGGTSPTADAPPF